MKGFIHSIETFGTVDGPGIRFVLFFQGCPMRCKFCHNPDTQQMCASKEMECDEVISEIKKYRNYLTDGGVTATGGEPLVQIDFLTELFTKLKLLGIHTCIDTSGVLFNSSDKVLLNKFDKLIKVTDLVLLDIKHINDNKHIKLTGQSNKNILEFAKYLSENNIDVIIRYVLIPTINADKETLTKTKEFIDTLKNVIKVDILPYHTMGIEKYKALSRPYELEGVMPPTSEQIELAHSILSNNKTKRGKEDGNI